MLQPAFGEAATMVASGNRAQYPDLAGRTVFISGGGSGIGAAFVRMFAAQGANVGFIDIDDAPSEALVRELSSDFSASVRAPVGALVRYWRCDVRDIAALRTAIAAVAAALGSIRVLVNNAARDDRHKLED